VSDLAWQLKTERPGADGYVRAIASSRSRG
jgi:hypothetical protein